MAKCSFLRAVCIIYVDSGIDQGKVASTYIENSKNRGLSIIVDMVWNINRDIIPVNYLGDVKYIDQGPSIKTLEFKFQFNHNLIDGLVELYQLQQHFQSGHSTKLEKVIIYYDGKIITGNITDWTWNKNNPNIEVIFQVYNEMPLYKEESKYELLRI